MNHKQSIIPEPISDEKVKEILRLSEEGKFTQAGIASEVGVSRATVGKYIRERKRQLAPKILRRFGDGDLQSLCEVITPIILEKLKQANPDGSQDEGEDKEKNKKEEKMSNGDMESKAQEIVDRREMLKKVEKIEQVAKDVEILKEQGKQVPEVLTQQIGELKAGIEGIKEKTDDFCLKFPDLCKSQQRLEQKLEQLEKKEPPRAKIGLGGHKLEHTDMEEFFQCCDSDDPESCSTPKLCGKIPASLKAKMLRHFCKDEACVKELEGQGFQLDGEGYREKYRGMLG